MASHMQAQAGNHGEAAKQAAAKGVEGINTWVQVTGSIS